MSGSNRFVPVAEYRGIAILERDGDKRSFWNGVEYRTDGKIWLWFHKTKNMIGIVALASEHDAKMLIDRLYADEGVDCPKDRFYSYRQACKQLGLAPQAAAWRWNEIGGYFVPVARVAHDGPNRIEG